MSMTQESTGGSERIVVGVDGSESSKAALAWAARQAKLTGATLTVISGWEETSIWGRSAGWLPGVDPAAETMAALNETISEVLGSEPGVDLTTAVIKGHAAPKLLEESKTASLIVVGSSGHGEFAGMLLGSVSAFLVTHASCPVAIIRGHGGARQTSH
jgi:nucleotide-binding universal stress UspA family protein